MIRNVLRAIFFIVVSCSMRLNAAPTEDGFRPIFDGRTLKGWAAPDMRYWSVEDEAITARSSDALPCRKNQFLVWQLGALDDFELRLQYRILGPEQANSGIQIRSEIHDDGHAVGYQADMDRGRTWLGALYDEHTGRRMLAKRGQRTVIDAAGKRTSTPLDVSALKVETDGWNDYHILCAGHRITLRVNGVLTSEVVDRHEGHCDLTGKLALQLHSGPPSSVQFRNIRLKRLPLAEGRKKVVMIAGAPSHGSGAHEHNAGIRLLARRIAKHPSVIAATYHDRGWPRDPTLLDNANAIVVYGDGQGRHPLAKHFDDVRECMKRGVGLMCVHYAVHVDKGAPGKDFREWIGGGYESDFSSNPHWHAELKVHADHPIGRGVRPARIDDEWYFNMRFREDMNGVTSILEAKPDDKARSKNGYPPKPYAHIIAASGRSETLMWAVERKDGGRGVGFTGGHHHHNWAFDTQRKVVLNAILWISGLAVPPEGFASDPVTEEELNQGLDKKRKTVRLKIPAEVSKRS